MFQFEIDTVDADIEAGDTTSTATDSKSPSTETGFAPGERVVVDKHIGTVRYVGPVGTHQGSWVGIEWDDPKRGKHNGTVDGVTYFQCTNLGSMASFVRPHKVEKTRLFAVAFHERYGTDESISAVIRPIDKQKAESRRISFGELTIMDLSAMNIATLEKAEEVAKLCPKVGYLNLAENFLQDWNEIVKLCRYFPLKRLDLSANRLKRDKVKINIEDFAGLEHLILGNNDYEWDQILDVPFVLPQLVNLQLQYNAISTFLPKIPALSKLKQLDLTGNQIAAWEEVLKLSTLQSLEYLNLAGNKLREVFFTDDSTFTAGKGEEVKGSGLTSCFPNLVRLNLSENSISEWSSVSQLNRLNKLRELRLEFNPFLAAESPPTGRLLVIARLEKLKKLEGVEINDRERKDAELELEAKNKGLTRQAAQTAGGGTDVCSKEVTSAPVTASELKAPAPEQCVPYLFGKPIKYFSLEITPADSTLASITKEVSPNMKLLEFRKMINNNYSKKVPFGQPKVEVISHRNPAVRFTLDIDYKTLDESSVENLDKIIVTWP